MPGIITFTGPSGVGKTTIIAKLFEELPALRFVSSYTTRSQRPTDLAEEFCYVAPKEFEEMDKRGEFLWSVRAHGNRYGTRKADVDEALLSPYYSVMTLVPEAASRLFAYTKGAVTSFFILSLDEETLRSRLKKRGEDEETIKRRVQDCVSWTKEARAGRIPYRYITNEGTVEEAAEEVRGFLL